MLRERETLRSRQHDSVIPLFASFSAGPEDPPIQDDTTEYLHLFFPHTDAGDMKKWLEMESPPDSLLIGRTARRKFIYQTIQDLASAIAFIHREIKSQIAYHHDLKPSNILLFRQEGRQPLWKICDFGHADLKHAEDTSGTALTDENRFGSYVYRPPEYFARSQDKHGRPFDIYSLGCIFLNLMTVVKHGWSNAGYREFERLRGINNDHIFDVPKGVMEDYSFHNNPTVVTSWVNRLKEGDHDQAFYGLLEIIEEMLQEKNRRIFSWEVDVDIFELLNGGVEEEMLRKRLEAVVQASKTAHSSIDNKHNPLQRAERKGQDWKIDILKQNKWSNWKPETLVTTSADSDVEEWRHSTLDDFAYTHEYVQNQLYGRHDIDKQIAAGFAKWKIVGLYGISGIG
jgi:serine/threonine protein kinase